jgi:O-antigen/teichoic acid export membrane protein
MTRNARTDRMWQGSAWMFAAELLILPTGLVTAGVLTRQLGPETYGLLSLGVTVVGWFQWMAGSMLARASNRAVAAAGDWRPVAAEVMHSQRLFGSVIGLLLLAVSPWLAAALRQPSLTPTLRLLAVDLVLIVVAQGYRGVLVATGAHGWLSLMSAVRWITRMLAVVAFVRLGWSIDGAVGGIALSSLATLLLARWRVGALPRAPRAERQRVRAGLFALAAPIALATMGARLFDRLDLLLLATLGGTAASLGHYGAAQNLTVTLSLLTGTVTPVVLAAVTRLQRHGDVDEALALQRDVVRLPILVLPFAALAAGAAPDLMRMIYGPSFLDAAVPFALLMIGATAMLAVSLSTVLLMAAERAWLAVAITGPMLAALIAATLLLLPRYGTIAPAMASMLVSVAAAGAAQATVKRMVTVHVPLRTVVVGAALALGAFSAATAWHTPTAPSAVAKLLTISAALVSALILLRELPTHVFSFVTAPLRGRATVLPPT